MTLSPLLNVFRVPELRKMIFYTFILLVIFRVGTYVTVPGVDSGKLSELAAQGGLMGLINMFTGGAISNAAVFGLGVMPYISASIIFQLLTTVIKPLEELSKEGEAGRKKINQYTRYATVGLCIIQAIIWARQFRSLSTPPNTFLHDWAVTGRVFGIFPVLELLCIVAMTGGSVFLMWIGEQITENGIGQGISLIIMAGIVARMPSQLIPIFERVQLGGLFTFDPETMNVFTIAMFFALYVAVVMGIVAISQGERRIPVQHAKLTRGRRIYGGQRHYMPLRVNSAGVIPIIFAQSILLLPGYLFQAVSSQWPNVRLFNTLQSMFTYGSFSWIFIYVVLIFFFCYFWTAVQFNPVRLADDMKEHGAFIPGIRPGRYTSEYLERVMGRITLAGSAFLAIIAILPMVLPLLITGLSQQTAYIYGGTGLLIVVGVALDVVQKIEMHLVMRHYEGFMRGGRIKGRFT